MRVSRTLAILSLAVLGNLSLHAQATSGNISGTVGFYMPGGRRNRSREHSDERGSKNSGKDQSG